MTAIPEVPWDVIREAPGIEVWARQLQDWVNENLPTIPEPFSLAQNIQDALQGNEGQPSASNRYVTEEGLEDATIEIVNTSVVTTLFANPTAQVGLTAVNGTALTAMRSDAAPSLDVSISPTWTGSHSFTSSIVLASTAALSWGSSGVSTPDLFVWRNSANWSEQYNSTNAQSWSLYGTRTSASAYERLTVKHNGSSSGITFTSEGAGGGAARLFGFMGASVGIGTAAPARTLHVVGSGIISERNTADPQLVLRRTGDIAQDWYLRVSNLASGGDLVFRDFTGGNLDVFTLEAGTGNVVFDRDATVGWGSAASASPDTFFRRNSANFAEQRNGSNAQSFAWYNTWTSTTNFERLRIQWASNIANIWTEKGSGGGTARALRLGTDAVAYWEITTAGNLVAVTDNGPEIGAASNRVKNIYVGTNIALGATSFGASMVGGMSIGNQTAPTGNVADAFQYYAADQAAGNSAPHWRSENGAVYRLFQSTGWTLPTGTASKAGFDTATATLTQVAQTIKAMMDHLLTGCALFAA